MKTANEELLLTALRAFVTRWKTLDLNSPWQAEAYMLFKDIAKEAEAAISKVQQ